MKGTIDNTEEDHYYWFKINKSGKSGTDCDAVEDKEELNPMYQKDEYGTPYTFQDRWLGRIEAVAPDTVGEFVWNQAELPLNIDGDEKIIGRSIAIF